ncbi:MAG: hypothetical protein CSA42_07910 [Gammaproteobacteria bacterium]|nr:MAG: hypothetical protein CSA42_07910 [Gammaproteobacteria bacterium]
MYFGINDIGLYILGTILTVIVPGANTYRFLQGVKQFGSIGGVYASSGVLLADFLFMVAAAMGVGVILQSSQLAYNAFLIIRGVYFAYLAIIILKDWRISIPSSVTTNSAATTTKIKNKANLNKTFKSSFLTCIVNFKAIFFYGLFLPAFINNDYSPRWIPLLLLSVICAIIILCYYALLSYAGLRIFKSKKWR